MVVGLQSEISPALPLCQDQAVVQFLPASGAEVKTEDNGPGDLGHLLARGRGHGHGHQGLPADVQLEERLMSCFSHLEQEVAAVGLLPSCVEPGLASLKPGADQGGDVQSGPDEGGDGLELGQEGGGDITAGPQSAGDQENGPAERRTEEDRGGEGRSTLTSWGSVHSSQN